MISLLHKSIIKNYDVLIIQKSWKNFKIITFLNASRFGFYLMYKLNVNIKICFYINQKINFWKRLSWNFDWNWWLKWFTFTMCIIHHRRHMFSLIIHLCSWSLNASYKLMRNMCCWKILIYIIHCDAVHHAFRSMQQQVNC